MKDNILELSANLDITTNQAKEFVEDITYHRDYIKLDDIAEAICHMIIQLEIQNRLLFSILTKED